ncbi:MAG TPA: SDR family oxidoreductase [Clostridia bacterium]|nr:SDR family oxidoreductase [Clostridia bacterium]
MKALFIGGTGIISTAITELFARMGGELYLLNRGNRNDRVPENVRVIKGDISDEKAVAALISDMKFDVVADFIAFTADQAERDYRLFNGKTKQYIFISSASAYQKPPLSYPVTESTPLVNPYWQYSRNKIACEEYLMKQHRENGFPVTIVRPSHTYDDRYLPLESWQAAKRMLEGKRVIIHGDGTTLWTLTHNSDFAKGFVGLMGNVHAIGDAIHITSDERLTWNQIYEIIADALGVELKAVHVPSEFIAACSLNDQLGTLIGDKANNAIFDNTKLKRLVPEFAATTRFDQGIRKTIANILNHPELQKSDPAYDDWCDRMIAAMDNALESVRAGNRK